MLQNLATGVLLLGAALGATACTDRLLEPTPEASPPQPAPAPPARAMVPPVSEEVVGSGFLDVPPNNSGGGSRDWKRDITFPGPGYYEVTTVGQVEYKRNPAADSTGCGFGCDPYHPLPDGAAGGWGLAENNSQLRTYFQVTTGGVPTEAQWAERTADGQATTVVAVGSRIHLWVRRDGIRGVKWCLQGSCSSTLSTGPTGWYLLQSTQKVEARRVTPLQVEPNKLEFVPGEVLTFTTTRHRYVGTSLQWSWEGANGVSTSVSCRTETCSYAPPGAGKMRVSGTLALSWTANYGVGAVTLPIKVQVPKLVLECGGQRASASVVRGTPIECVVRKEPATAPGTIIVEEWTFAAAPRRDAPLTSTTWGGVMVQSGIVQVRGKINSDGPLQTDSVRITVQDRGWTWATKAVSLYPAAADPGCLNHTPTYRWADEPTDVAANGVNLPASVNDCVTGQRFVQPDSYSGAGDGFSVGTVSSGPNYGMHYVVDATLSIKRKAAINSGMLPDAMSVGLDGANLTDCGTAANAGRANWFDFMQCKEANPAGYIEGVRAHEGHGTNGNNGHFSAGVHAMQNPANDPMIYFDKRVGSNALSRSQFISETRVQFQDRAAMADTATKDGNGIVAGNYTGPYWGYNAGTGMFICGTTSL